MAMLTRRTFLTAVGCSALCAAASSNAPRVRIGVCSRDIAGAVRYGFDYIEPAVADMAAMSEQQFREYADQLLASPIRCEAFNSFIRRPDLKVVGNAVSTSALSGYIEGCLARCRKLGARIVVWGSATSRNVPEGFPRERAQEQIAAFLRMAGDIAQRHQIVIAIEPLRHQESNILNTGVEALEMVRTVKHPNVRMIIDYFHLRAENEDPKIVEVAQGEIVHLHFANPHGRVWPHDIREDDGYGAFFRYLKAISYSGGISIEGRGSFGTDGAQSLAFFREALG